MEIYDLTTFYIVAMEIFLAFSIVRVLKFSAIKNPAIGKASIVFGFWLTAVLILFGVLKVLPQDISSMALFGIILVGITASGVFFYLLKDEFLALPQEFLLLPQAFRMFFGAGFIVEAVFNIIPAVYGVVDGMLHITTAFLATTLAIYIARGYKCRKSLISVNIFGLFDLVIVASGIAFVILGDIGSGHNLFLAVFFAAPIFIWLHLISLYKVFFEKIKIK